MKFFFDRCMSIRLCRMIAILEAGKHELSHHDEDSRFTQNTPDTEWIGTLSRDPVRPVVVSGDCKILRRPAEVAELKASALTFFFLTDHWSDFPIHDMVWRFFKVWPAIVKEASVSVPTVFQIFGGKSLKIERYSKTAHLK